MTVIKQNHIYYCLKIFLRLKVDYIKREKQKPQETYYSCKISTINIKFQWLNYICINKVHSNINFVLLKTILIHLIILNLLTIYFVFSYSVFIVSKKIFIAYLFVTKYM